MLFHRLLYRFVFWKRRFDLEDYLREVLGIVDPPNVASEYWQWDEKLKKIRHHWWDEEAQEMRMEVCG